MTGMSIVKRRIKLKKRDEAWCVINTSKPGRGSVLEKFGTYVDVVGTFIRRDDAILFLRCYREHVAVYYDRMLANPNWLATIDQCERNLGYAPARGYARFGA